MREVVDVKPWLGANWKMHKTVREAREYVARWNSLVEESPLGEEAEVVLFPPFTALAAVGEALVGASLGAQDVYPEDQGAFTGEISPLMLAELGVRYVLVGHSERRHILGEEDAFLRRKFDALVARGFVPVLCVGETAEERRAGRTEEVLLRQLEGVLGGREAFPGTFVVAYEPVWAIGTGTPATPEDAAQAVARIRTYLHGRFGAAADGVPVVYGGSVDPENVGGFVRPGVSDGALVGSKSLEADVFYRLVRNALEAWREG